MGLKNFKHFLNLLLITMVSIVLSCCSTWILVEMFIFFTSFISFLQFRIIDRQCWSTIVLSTKTECKNSYSIYYWFIFVQGLRKHPLLFTISRGKRQTRESLPWRKGLFVASAPPQRCLEPSPHPPPQGLDEKRIQQLLCFTCCKNTPQKTRSVPPTHACSSLNYLTPHYIIATGCTPDNAWLLSNCLSVLLSCFLQNFFFYYFQPSWVTLLTGQRVWLPLLTVGPSSVWGWQLIFYLCHGSPRERHLRGWWTCITPVSQLNGDL